MITPALPRMDAWLWTRTLSETLAAGLDPAGTGRRQRDARLRQLIESTWIGSPFYQERLRRAGPGLQDIEPVEKTELMLGFDDWATDRRITRDSVERFLEDPERIAAAYLGDYLVWTSSGTTGHPGIFIQDAQSLATFDALDTLRLRGSPAGLGAGAAMQGAWGTGQRCAFVAAIGGHFAGIASIERVRRLASSTLPLPFQWFAPTVRTFSVLDPMDQLAGELQAFAPSVLITYPSCAAALAQAQIDGALNLRLAEVWLGGEQLTGEQRARIHQAFGCTLRNNYGASEFFSMAWECRHGRMHLNDDWLILEPVDRNLRPVPAGEASHSVLLTNLANRTQPLLRYRLSDSVRFDPRPCPCGSAFPVIEVLGRADHTLVLRDAHDRAVTLLPLALLTVIEEGAHVTQFQLLCTAPDVLELRFEVEVADAAAAFRHARTALRAFLVQQGLSNVSVVHGRHAPARQARSGKLCRVLAVEPSAKRDRAVARKRGRT